MTSLSSRFFRRLLFISSVFLLTNNTYATNQNTDDITTRIAPVGKVCIVGQQCDSATKAQHVAVNTVAVNTEKESAYSGRAPEKIYNTYCIACHSTGAAGAPRIGNAKEWKPHIAKGMDTLLKDAIKGIGAMPPRGICTNCSDEELQHTIQYMVDKSQ